MFLHFVSYLSISSSLDEAATALIRALTGEYLVAAETNEEVEVS